MYKIKKQIKAQTQLVVPSNVRNSCNGLINIQVNNIGTKSNKNT